MVAFNHSFILDVDAELHGSGDPAWQIEPPQSVPAQHGGPVESASRRFAIWAELLAGTYETPERLDIAVERLLDEIQ